MKINRRSRYPSHYSVITTIHLPESFISRKLSSNLIDAADWISIVGTKNKSKRIRRTLWRRRWEFFTNSTNILNFKLLFRIKIYPKVYFQYVKDWFEDNILVTEIRIILLQIINFKIFEFYSSELCSPNLRWCGFQYCVSGIMCKVFLRYFQTHSLIFLYFFIMYFFIWFTALHTFYFLLIFCYSLFYKLYKIRLLFFSII